MKHLAFASLLLFASVPLMSASTQSVAPGEVAETSPATSLSATLDSAAARGPEAYAELIDEAQDKYYDPDSPDYDESAMALVAAHVMANTKAPADIKARMAFIAQDIAHNAPGTIAPDFTVKKIDGTTLQVSELVAKSPRAMLYFYDPDCNTCHEIMATLGADKLFNKSIDNGLLTVIGVNIVPSRKKNHNLPQGWLDVNAAEPIDEDGRYSIRTTPTIYVLDSDMRVVTKGLKVTGKK